MRIGRRTKAVAAGVGLSGLLAGVAVAEPVLVDFSNAGSVEILVDPEAGDSYLYEDVRAGVDALVTIVSATDVTAFDTDPSTLLDNLVVDRSQSSDIFKDPQDINTLLPNTGGATGTPKSVTYRIDFRDASTGDPVTVSDVAITTKDLDGIPEDGVPEGEYVEFAGITRYCLTKDTGIVVTQDPDDGSYRFAGNDNHNLANKPGWAEVFFGPVSSIVVTVGQSLGWLAQIAQSFDAAGWGETATVCPTVDRPTYTLTYDANGATTGTVPDPTSGDGALTIASNTGALARSPRTFSGWNSRSDGTGQSFPPGASYTPASDLVLFAQFQKAAQTITLPAVTTHPATGAAPALGDDPFAVTVSASSGLAVTLDSTTPAVCSTTGTTVTLLALGDCTLTADQAGDADYEAASQVTTTFTIGLPVPRPVPAAPTVSCTPDTIRTGTRVTCTVSRGDPGIEILWRASYDPTFVEAAVTLDEDGRGSFSFVVPASAVGSEVSVELVDWTAPLSLGTIDGSVLVPTGVPAGAGPGDPRTAWWLGAAMVLGLSARRFRRGTQRS